MPLPTVGCGADDTHTTKQCRRNFRSMSPLRNCNWLPSDDYRSDKRAFEWQQKRKYTRTRIHTWLHAQKFATCEGRGAPTNSYKPGCMAHSISWWLCFCYTQLHTPCTHTHTHIYKRVERGVLHKEMPNSAAHVPTLLFHLTAKYDGNCEICVRTDLPLPLAGVIQPP